MILALTAFSAVVLAEPQFGLITLPPFPNPPRFTAGPRPAAGEFRDPGTSPSSNTPPGRGGLFGRFGRQLDFNSIVTSIQNAAKNIPGLPPIPFNLPAGLPDFTNFTRLG